MKGGILMTTLKIGMLELPLIPLRGLSVFPYMVLHFDVGREKSIKALEEAMMRDQMIFLTTQRDVDIDLPEKEDFYEIGTICKVKQMLKLPGDAIRVLVEGVARGKVLEYLYEEPYFNVHVERYIEMKADKSREVEALMRGVVTAFETYVNVSNRISPDVLVSVTTIDEPGRFADTVASHLVLKTDQKQAIIEAFDEKARLELIYQILLTEIEILEVEKEINEKVRGQINRLQKEYYLKEQMKAIKEELGEDYDYDDEIQEFQDKLAKLKMPADVKEKVMKEIERMARMAPASAEGGVIRSYITWILDLPWNNETKDVLDITKARKILEEDHYGLKDVKERVLEYLAIRQLTKSMKGPIICLVGPPGVGKTSIARSIARSLNRKFVRMSLGGVRDEAEIRGHRRTYIGAIPGRIISAIKEAKSKNPVFLLDEIDKLNSDFRGDPASALLEVLDPEQNKDFKDHYLEIAFDLSKVMFVTTANSLSGIPRALLDRMEVIEVAGYTELEKLQIAKRYLVTKQMKEHGIKDKQLQLPDEVISRIINNYTRESGVRELERKIAAVCRKSAMRLVEGKVASVRVTRANLDKFLGIAKFHYDEANKQDEVGIATGLAWTSVGGETLQIEVTPMKGSGKLVLTGQMGDVMKESARAGLSYIRAKAEEFHIDEDFHKNIDIHIHIPEGAIPKDGPSAGITMATAVTSALTGLPVRHEVAMTGEITLRGRVLPIGGLKEKSLAGKRAGVTKILIPKENEKDLEDIPDEVKKAIEFVVVSSMDEVLDQALVGNVREIRNENKQV